MRKYVIERDIPGIGSLPAESYCAGAQRSNQALGELGTRIQWVESYVTADKLFCVYLAEDEALSASMRRKAVFPPRTSARCAPFSIRFRRRREPHAVPRPSPVLGEGLLCVYPHRVTAADRYKPATKPQQSRRPPETPRA